MERLVKTVYPFPAYSFIGFNLRKPIFQDVRVRHAIDLLIPRDQILTQVYLTATRRRRRATTRQASPNYNHDIPPTPYDPAQATELLRQAGWKQRRAATASCTRTASR